MPITDIIHVAIKTMDLEATNKFYSEVLEMTFSPLRPPMHVPGSWLDFNKTQLHILAGDGAYGPDQTREPITGSIDHLAVHATGYDAMKQRLIDHDVDYRENDITTSGLWQLFVRDPNGVVIEMNFRKADEPEGSVGPKPDAAHQYDFGRF